MVVLRRDLSNQDLDDGRREQVGIGFVRRRGRMFDVILAVGVAVLLVAFGACHFGMFQARSPWVDEKIAGPMTISTEWAEIRPEKPLKRTGDHQEIGLYVGEPFIVVFDSLDSHGIRMPDGSIVSPEVQLVDTEGNTVTLKFSGARGKETISYRLPDEQKERQYRSVRIRAEREIQLKSVYWTGIVIKNMP
jgi:hypothetical protein